MTTVILHGQLAKKFGKRFDLEISSPLEGIRALSTLKQGFDEQFRDGSYYIYTQSNKTRTYLTEDTVKLSTKDEIHIVPSVSGGKSKGTGKLIAGVALMGVAFIPGLNAAVFGALAGVAAPSGVGSAALHATLASVASVSAKAAFLGGLTTALGGASQLIAPKIGEEKESSLFSGTPESVTEGAAVPLVYGDYLAIGYPVTFELVTGLNNYSTLGTTGGGGNGSGSGGTTGGWDTVNIAIDL